MKYVLLYLLTFLSLSASAQTDTVYLNSKGVAVNNSKKAKSYAVRQKLEDSAYFIRQYDMRDTIMIQGTYKDAQMTIPHGRFIYYANSFYDPHVDLRFSDHAPEHVINFISVTGYYLNGIKNGVWITYWPSGKKIRLTTYSNGKKHGLYQDYNWYGELAGEGNYINDLKDGNWCTLDVDSTVIEYGVFKNDKKIKSDTIFRPLNMSDEFRRYIGKKLRPYFEIQKIDSADANFTVNTKGEIVDIKINQEVVSNIAEDLTNIIAGAPKLIPESYNHIPLERRIHFRFLNRVDKSGNYKSYYFDIWTPNKGIAPPIEKEIIISD